MVNAVLTVCFTIFLQPIAMELGVLALHLQSVLLLTVLLTVFDHHPNPVLAVFQIALLDNSCPQTMNLDTASVQGQTKN